MKHWNYLYVVCCLACFGCRTVERNGEPEQGEYIVETVFFQVQEEKKALTQLTKLIRTKATDDDIPVINLAMDGLLASPDVKKRWLPSVGIDIGQARIIANTKPYTYETAWDDRGYPTKYGTDVTGTILQMKVHSVSNSTATFSFNIEERSRLRWTENKIGDWGRVFQYPSCLVRRFGEIKIKIPIGGWIIQTAGITVIDEVRYEDISALIIRKKNKPAPTQGD